tara:strand:+ start:1829 stop:2494 length:666 start_codon:yes stop_codon:yes gene_type:complete
MGLKLLVEKPAPEEEFEYITEEKDKNSPSTLFISGPYMMAESVNRNKRMYPIEEMRREVTRYTDEMIKAGRAMGELNHPTSPDVDLERACHLVTEMSEDGNVFYGKSKVLSTPSGHLVKCLINDGVKVGMSSRALGSLVEEGSYNKVSDLRLVAVDCVADPSFPKAFVNGILESKEFVLGANGHSFEVVYDELETGISKLPKRRKDDYLREQIIKFIRKMK